MHATILALSTAVPQHQYSQKEIASKFIDIFSLDEEKKQKLQKIYQNSAIQKRYSVIGDFHKPKEDWQFWGPLYPQTIPGTSSRNAIYKKEAPQLSLDASQKALERWGGSLSEITHVISVSCTGMIAPGIEYYLMQKLGLSPSVNRLGINFMGCFGAFKGLSVARAFALENPSHRVLLVCTELCTLHLQADQDGETLVANSIFADGSAAAIVGMDPTPSERPLWEIMRTHSIGIENSHNLMSWEASDHGYLMRLSPTVPVHIGRNIKGFIQALLKTDTNLHECDWAIHPGGKSILQAVERALELEADQTKSSWEILANYGNMSSGTFLFVLEHLSQQAELRPWSAGLAFGPGLSVEGILLRLPKSKS